METEALPAVAEVIVGAPGAGNCKPDSFHAWLEACKPDSTRPLVYSKLVSPPAPVGLMLAATSAPVNRERVLTKFRPESDSATSQP